MYRWLQAFIGYWGYTAGYDGKSIRGWVIIILPLVINDRFNAATLSHFSLEFLKELHVFEPIKITLGSDLSHVT